MKLSCAVVEWYWTTREEVEDLACLCGFNGGKA